MSLQWFLCLSVNRKLSNQNRHFASAAEVVTQIKQLQAWREAYEEYYVNNETPPDFRSIFRGVKKPGELQNQARNMDIIPIDAGRTISDASTSRFNAFLAREEPVVMKSGAKRKRRPTEKVVAAREL